MPAYAVWTVRASAAWGRLAAELKAQTGLDVCLQQNGGFHLTLGDDEFEQRVELVKQMHKQAGAADYKMEMLPASEVKKMLPLIGSEVSGGSFCPLDGHVNSLRTFRAFHTGFKSFGIDYFPERPVSAIALEGGEFRLTTPKGKLLAGKIVLAAGNANQTLAPMVGLSAPMGPTRILFITKGRFLKHRFERIASNYTGREVKVAPADAVRILEERGLSRRLAEEHVNELVQRRIDAIPALRDRGLAAEAPARLTRSPLRQ